MPIATWTPELSIGVESLDADHKKLIDTLNEVFDALLLGRSAASLRAALATLNHYVAEHFAREEAWMGERDDPDLPRHQREHQALRDHLERLVAMQDASDEDRSIELLMILRDWLLGHIARSDHEAATHPNGAALAACPAPPAPG